MHEQPPTNNQYNEDAQVASMQADPSISQKEEYDISEAAMLAKVMEKSHLE